MLSFISRFKNRDTNEQGFSMVELLVVMLIMGILAAIAIPMYLNQKKSAVDTTVASDVKNAGNEVEGALASYPDGSCIKLGVRNTTAKPYYPLEIYPAVATTTTCGGTRIGLTNVYISNKDTVLSIPASYNDVYSANGYGIKGTNTNGDISKVTGYTFYANKGGLQ